MRHIYKQDFYKICKMYINNGSFTDPSIDFLQDCNSKNVSPVPVFVKIQNKEFNLVGYRLNEDHVAATAKYIQDHDNDPAFEVASLIIHNNGFTDKSFATLLEVIAPRNKLKHITYSCNELKH